MTKSAMIKLSLAQGGDFNHSINAWSQNNPLKSLGASLLPGVGTALFGNNALSDFRNGRVWSGLGNTLGAGMSLIPGGGALAKGMGFAGKGLSKGMTAAGKMLGSRSMPTFGKAMGGMGQGANKMMSGLGSGMGKLQAGTQSLASRVPGMKPLLGAAQKRPGTTTALGVGGFMGTGAMQGLKDQRQMLTNQNSIQIGNYLNSFRDSPGFNPIWARPRTMGSADL